MKVRLCELCNAQATLFCPSDDAFLCSTCDAKVHDANFLVARHLRKSLCSNCNSFTAVGISGLGFHPLPATCPPPSDLDSLSSSSSSSVCISSTTKDSTATTGKSQKGGQKPRVDYLKAEGILENWFRKLGVGAGEEMARRVVRVCVDGWGWSRVLPLRVWLAASMWLGLRVSGEKSWEVLKRLEEISGVPAKIIGAAEARLERGLRGGGGGRVEVLEEGWAEC
ncbi:B-box zinc finger protein 32 [Sesamum indicum]|uniref:B-box zinc finger protein 32 n=1 Tax=Sesamum indicum TaxID=4182 RepID=A0A6I9SRE5_SESIN|nr:B-box zinc finger protein 32 [Sesamum indicum]